MFMHVKYLIPAETRLLKLKYTLNQELLDAHLFQAVLPLVNTKLLSFATATKTVTLEKVF